MTATESLTAPIRSMQAVPPSGSIGFGAGAQFCAQKISSTLVRVGVAGEIDIRNAVALSDFALGQLRSSSRVILDLSEVEFFGTAGLRVFEELDGESGGAGARWALVCGRPVQRLLRIIDPDQRVPAYTSLESAMRALHPAA
ncbi:STAS domain-containing protein [Rhodococcus sp. NPDC060086]|uniref:STAS domain-containing protein n=1 Tax=Rhodococcus sp. NPDC060086 TaxID=3347055 RepID=UPI0036680A5B